MSNILKVIVRLKCVDLICEPNTRFLTSNLNDVSFYADEHVPQVTHGQL